MYNYRENMIYSYLTSYSIAPLLVGFVVGMTVPLVPHTCQWILRKVSLLMSPNQLQKGMIHGAYNILYITSCFHIKVRQFSRWLSSVGRQWGLLSSDAVSAEYSIEYVKQGEVIQHAMSDNIENYYASNEHINADFVICGVHKSHQEGWLKKVCDFPLDDNDQMVVKDAGIKFVDMQLQIKRKGHNEPPIQLSIQLKTPKYNYYTTGGLLNKAFMLYYLKNHADISAELKTELNTLYLNGEWHLHIVDHDVNQLTLLLHNDETITFLEDGGYSLTYVSNLGN